MKPYAVLRTWILGGHLGNLPLEVLDYLMDILSSQGGGSGIRATCHRLHDAFDAHNTTLVLGGRTLIEHIASDPSFGSDDELVEFVRGAMLHTPCLNNLKVQNWFPANRDSRFWSDLRDHTEIQHFDFSNNNSGGARNFLIPTTIDKRANLLHMDLRNTSCDYLHLLSACTLLRHLNLRLCRDFDGNLEPLAACVYLQHLDLGRCQNLRDLSPLQACVELQHLDVRWTGVTDLAPLASCMDMRHLNIRNTPVRSLVPLLACRDMQHLDLSGCQALEEKGLAGVMAVFTALRRLNLHGSNVLDLIPRDLFKSIKGLDLKV